MKIIDHGYTVDRTFIDYPDDSSEATIVFFYGCSHACEGCHNPELQEFRPYNKEKLLEDIKTVSLTATAPPTDKVVLSGGDPFFPLHFDNTIWLMRHLKMLDFKVCVYTGFDINFVRKKLVKWFDFIKCGVYNIQLSRPSEKTDEHFILSSSNQDFYNSKYKKISTNGKLMWRKHD